jgi:hypothetical protein
MLAGGQALVRLEAGILDLRDLVEHISAFADIDLGWAPGQFEMIIAGLEHLPELEVLIVAVARHVFRCHAKWQSFDDEVFLPALEGIAGKTVDLEHLLVGHRVAAGRRAGTMHHQVGAGSVVGAVVAVGNPMLNER